jgi:uncharacterized phage-like protein YoqJ
MIKVLAITGYKPYELGIFHNQHEAIHYIKKAIQKPLIQFAEEGLEWAVISGQLGVELWAAEVVLDLQIDYPQLKLAVLTPFLNQEENWNEENKEYYEFIVSQADFVDSITKRNYENPGQFRLKNQFIVEKSDGLLIVYDDEKEGSPKFMLDAAKKKAEKGKYDIFPITFYDLQAIIEEEQMRKWDNVW